MSGGGCRLSVSKLIQKSVTGNEAMYPIRPKVVVGSMTAVMFYAFFIQCQPLFLFQLLKQFPQFDLRKYSLYQLCYQYINSIEDIGPGYTRGVDVASLLFDGSELASFIGSRGARL
jgi:hypothetical protein